VDRSSNLPCCLCASIAEGNDADDGTAVPTEPNERSAAGPVLSSAAVAADCGWDGMRVAMSCMAGDAWRLLEKRSEEWCDDTLAPVTISHVEPA
jgi:hypothetical protein